MNNGFVNGTTKFFAPLSYQQCCFFKDSLNDSEYFNGISKDLKFLKHNIDNLEKFIKKTPTPFVLIRPSAMKYVKTLRRIGVSQIMLDNGIIQRKKPFTIEGLRKKEKDILKWLQLIDYFIVYDVPLWKFGNSIKNTNIALAEIMLKIVPKKLKHKLILPLHFADESDFLHYKDLLFRYNWVGIASRPKQFFNKRKGILGDYWSKTHVFGWNSKDIGHLTDAFSFDSAYYNLLVKFGKRMILRNGREVRIKRRLTKTEMILLSLNNAKYFPHYLEVKNALSKNQKTLEYYLMS